MMMNKSLKLETQCEQSSATGQKLKFSDLSASILRDLVVSTTEVFSALPLSCWTKL